MGELLSLGRIIAVVMQAILYIFNNIFSRQVVGFWLFFENLAVDFELFLLLTFCRISLIRYIAKIAYGCDGTIWIVWKNTFLAFTYIKVSFLFVILLGIDLYKDTFHILNAEQSRFATFWINSFFYSPIHYDQEG